MGQITASVTRVQATYESPVAALIEGTDRRGRHLIVVALNTLIVEHRNSDTHVDIIARGFRVNPDGSRTAVMHDAHLYAGTLLSEAPCPKAPEWITATALHLLNKPVSL